MYPHRYPLDLEWWAAIMGVTCILRLMLIPLTVVQQRAAARLHLAKPEIEALSARAKQSNSNDPEAMKRHQTQLAAIWSKHSCHPGMMIVPILVQAPLMISFYFAISRMSEDLPTMKHGGDFWFTDLSTSDPTMVLPVLSATSFLLSVEFGGAAGAMGGGAPAPTDNTQKYTKYAMRGMAVAMVPMTAYFPNGVFVYWVTTNLFTFGQMMVLKIPAVKHALGIPEMSLVIPPPVPVQPSVTGQAINMKFDATPQLYDSRELYDSLPQVGLASSHGMTDRAHD